MNDRPTWLGKLWGFGRIVLVAQVGIALIVGLVCVINWRTMFHYGNGLFLVGTLAAVVGSVGLLGGWFQLRAPREDRGRATGSPGVWRQLRRLLLDAGGPSAPAILLLSAGVLSMTLSVAVHALFGYL